MGYPTSQELERQQCHPGMYLTYPPSQSYDLGQGPSPTYPHFETYTPYQPIQQPYPRQRRGRTPMSEEASHQHSQKH